MGLYAYVLPEVGSDSDDVAISEIFMGVVYVVVDFTITGTTPLPATYRTNLNWGDWVEETRRHFKLRMRET